MTHADTIAAFLRKITAHPADDGPRLVMADWCEEHGRGERAEYIRIGCELAKTKKEPCCDINGNTIEGDEHRMKIIPCPFCEWSMLHRRAYELLTQHEPEWTDEFMPDARWTYAVSDRSFTFLDGGQAIFHWNRGFISQAECTLETWRGGPCRQFGYAPDEPHMLCARCHGWGRTGGIGSQLVRRAPIEAVVVTDREPFSDNGNYAATWFDESLWRHNEQHPQSNLPHDLILAIEAECSYIGYPSADAANAALSAAMLAEARAALEPSGPRVVQCGT